MTVHIQDPMRHYTLADKVRREVAREEELFSRARAWLEADFAAIQAAEDQLHRRPAPDDTVGVQLNNLPAETGSRCAVAAATASEPASRGTRREGGNAATKEMHEPTGGKGSDGFQHRNVPEQDPASWDGKPPGTKDASPAKDPENGRAGDPLIQVLQAMDELEFESPPASETVSAHTEMQSFASAPVVIAPGGEETGVTSVQGTASSIAATAATSGGAAPHVQTTKRQAKREENAKPMPQELQRAPTIATLGNPPTNSASTMPVPMAGTVSSQRRAKLRVKRMEDLTPAQLQTELAKRVQLLRNSCGLQDLYVFVMMSDGGDTVNTPATQERALAALERDVGGSGMQSIFKAVAIGRDTDTRFAMAAKLAIQTVAAWEQTPCHYARRVRMLPKVCAAS